MADLSYKFTGVNTAQLANEVQLLRQNSSTFRALEAAAAAAGYKTIEIRMGPGLSKASIAGSQPTDSSTWQITINSDATGSWGAGGRQATVGEVIAHELAHAVVPQEFQQPGVLDYTEGGKEGMWVRRQAGQVAGDLGLPGANNADYLLTPIPVDKEQACRRGNPLATTPQDGVLFLDGSRGYNGRGSTVPPGLGDPDPSSSRRLATDETGQFSDRFGNWGSAPASAVPPAASDQPESFDSRFGNWGMAPAARFGDTRSPVLRALEKYSGSVVPDSSVSTSAPAHGMSWGMPSSPPNIIGTGGVLGSYMDPSRGMSSSPPGIIGTGGVLGNYMDPSLIVPAQGALPTASVSSGPIAPDLPADETETASSKPVRYLGSRIAGQPQVSMSSAGAQAVPPSPQPNEPLVGIFSGQPMFPFPPPPSFWSRRDDTRVRSDDEEERSLRWLRLLSPR